MLFIKNVLGEKFTSFLYHFFSLDFDSFYSFVHASSKKYFECILFHIVSSVLTASASFPFFCLQKNLYHNSKHNEKIERNTKKWCMNCTEARGKIHKILKYYYTALLTLLALVNVKQIVENTWKHFHTCHFFEIIFTSRTCHIFLANIVLIFLFCVCF